MLLTRYFTFLNLILIFFHQYTHQHVNLLFTSLVVSGLGFMFYNICPGEFRGEVFGLKITVKKVNFMFDILMHHIPLIFVIYKYLRYYSKTPFDVSFLNAHLLLILYLIINKDAQEKVYGCNNFLLVAGTFSISYALYLILVLV